LKSVSLRYILILSFHLLGLSTAFFPKSVSTKNLCFFVYLIQATCSDHRNISVTAVTILGDLCKLHNILHSLNTQTPNILLSTLILNTSNFLPSKQVMMLQNHTEQIVKLFFPLIFNFSISKNLVDDKEILNSIIRETILLFVLLILS